MSDKTNDKKTSELKQCPFCGGEAEFYRTPVKSNGGWCDSVVVRCKECEARTNRILYDASKHENDSEYDEAAAAWNQRKPMERILKRLEEYRDDFMNDIYEELREDTDNLRANRIIDRFDEAIAIVMEEGGLNDL